MKGFSSRWFVLLPLFQLKQLFTFTNQESSTYYANYINWLRACDVFSTVVAFSFSGDADSRGRGRHHWRSMEGVLLHGEHHLAVRLDHFDHFHVRQVTHRFSVDFKYLVSSLQSSLIGRSTWGDWTLNLVNAQNSWFLKEQIFHGVRPVTLFFVTYL